MAQTVMDVVLELTPDSSVVLVERHFSYLMSPLIARCPDEAVAFARNLAELEPPVMFLLDRKGLEGAWQQGRVLAETKIAITEIIGSHQGRGPDTGLRICEAHSEITRQPMPFRCHSAVNYPIYEYEPVLKCLREMDNPDPMVAQWLNGQRPELIRSDTPSSFKGRVMGFLDDLLQQPGLRIITTHFEIVTLVHGLLIEGINLGSFPEDWAPKKGGGVIIIRKSNGEQIAYDYNPDLTIIV